jgi:hypothetical protein
MCPHTNQRSRDMLPIKALVFSAPGNMSSTGPAGSHTAHEVNMRYLRRCRRLRSLFWWKTYLNRAECALHERSTDGKAPRVR